MNDAIAHAKLDAIIDTQADIIMVQGTLTGINKQILTALGGMNEVLTKLAGEGAEADKDTTFHDLIARVAVALERLSDIMTTLPSQVESAVIEGVKLAEDRGPHRG